MILKWLDFSFFLKELCLCDVIYIKVFTRNI